MSATAVIDPTVSATARRVQPEPVAPRPRIEAVPSTDRSAPPKLVYGIVAVVGLFAIIVIQLLVSVGLSQGAYQISALQTEQKALTRSNAEKQDTVDTLNSPQNLATAAQGLGMVANAAPVYLRLSDGAVLGDPKSAARSEISGGVASALVPAAVNAAPKPGTVPTGVSASSPVAGATAVPLQGELPAPITH